MAAFDNSGHVHQQIAHQVVGGDVYNIASHDTLSKRQKFMLDGALSAQALDDEILESLPFPEMTDRRRNVAIPHRRTCQWIFELEQYKSWKANQTGLLWIKGKPGTGKSTLMSHLYQEVSPERHASNGSGLCLEFFFNARGSPLQQSFLGMLRSLSNQIFYRDATIRDLLRTSYRTRQDSFGNKERAWQWHQPELERVFMDMALTSARRQPLVIFIDALDEAGAKAAREIAEFFHDLNDLIHELSAMAKICISSRHYPVPSHSPAVEIWMEHNNQDDIMTYTQDQVHSVLQSSGTWSTEWSDLIDELASMAGGIFQWVHLVIPMVLEWIDEGETPDQARKHLSQVPTGLLQVYEHTLKNVIDPRHRVGALQLFRWVCLAQRPLSVTELRYALGANNIVADPFPQSRCCETPNFAKTDEIMMLRIKSWSGGLIECMQRKNSSKTYAQPIHQSVNDYILAYGLAVLFEGTISRMDSSTADTSSVNPIARDAIVESHAELYRACLCYLAAEQKEHIALRKHLDFEHWHIKAKKASNYSFTLYAVAGVFVHGQRAQSHRGQDLRQELQLLEYVLYTLSDYNLLIYPDKTRTIFGGRTTPLHVAAYYDFIDLAVYTQKQGRDVQAVNNWGCTALHFAAEKGHLKMVQVLVEMGLDVRSKSHYGGTPLIAAAASGHVDTFRWLLGQRTNPDELASELSAALVAAASYGSMVITELCIAAGADVNSQSVYGHQVLREQFDGSRGFESEEFGNSFDIVLPGVPYGSCGTALQAASSKNYREIVQLLLEKGANVNAEGDQHDSALQVASRQGSQELVQLLLQNGANINARAGEFGHALQAATLNKDSYSISRLLLEKGADVNAQGGHYGNALQAASESGSEEVVQLLLEKGADVNTEGGEYGSALQAASISGNEEVFRLLLEKGADVNAQGGAYGSALQAASTRRDGYELVQLLLEKGADVNAQGGYFGNALQAAFVSGSEEVIQLLLEKGADVNA